MTDAALFERNLQVFAERLPDLYRRLMEVSTPLSSVVTDDNGAAVDIHLNPGLLYKLDARDAAREQVEAFLKAPVRANYNIPSARQFDSMISRRVSLGLTDSLLKHNIESLPPQPVATDGYLIILGVGLGHHLPLLLNSLDSHHIIIFEPFPEFLLHSLHAIDWQQLFACCDEHGRTLDVICESRPDEIAAYAIRVFEKNNPTLVDGSYFFTHLPLWNLSEAKRRMLNDIPRQMTVRGYYEDERKMLCNSVVNMHKCDFHLLEGVIRPRKNIPVFLVAAGPSFDEAADFIEAWRDYAIIISSGSALQPLLNRGIIPDYQTEIENTPDQYDKTRHILESNAHLFPEGKFTGITLIASSTLNPRVPQFYENTIFFLRDCVVPTTAFAGKWRHLSGAAPTVANTSLVASACMGFNNFYLFGFDCGWRDGKDHHAKETIYYTSDTFKTEEMSGQYTLRGNFGGNFQTDMIFDWSKNLLEQAIGVYRMRVFNCSDGAFLEGSVPKVPEALEFTEILDRKAVIGAIRDGCPHFPAGTFLQGVDLQPLKDELIGFVSEIHGAIDRCLANNTDFPEFAEAAWAIISRASENRRVGALISFSTTAELKQGGLFINRVGDPEARLKVTRDYLIHLRELHQEMLDQSLTIFREMQDMLENKAEPSWSEGLATTPGTSY